MRILHLTDTHLGAWWPLAPDASVPRGWSRAVDHHRAFERALDRADELDVDLIVHTGDVFDRGRPPWRWVQAAADALTRAAARRPVVVLSGNHDRHGLSKTLPLHVPGLHIVDRPENVEIRGHSGDRVRLACVPYRRNVLGWVHGAHQALAGGADLLLAHQSFDGVRVPGLTFRVGAQRDTVGVEHLGVGEGDGPVHAVLCGHIHPRQVVACGPVPVVHPGCLVHTAMRDRAHPEGLAVWELGRTVRWRFVDQPGRALQVVRTPADLGGVVPGALVQVRVEEGACARDLEEAVRERGGWLMARSRTSSRRKMRPDPARQLRLFA